MNVFWWIAIACLVITVLCIVIAVVFDTTKGSAVDDTLGALCGIAIAVGAVCFIFGIEHHDSGTKDQQKKHLQKIGFSYVNVDDRDEAVVSMPTHAKGCRLKLEKDGKFWALRLPKDQTRSITTAKEVASWPSIVEWCKQPQPK